MDGVINMCRTRIIEVDKCNTCPFLRYTIIANVCVLSRNKEIKDTNSLPKWCKLEFYPYYYGNDSMKDEYGDY